MSSAIAGVVGLSSLSSSISGNQQLEERASALEKKAVGLESQGFAEETAIRRQASDISGQQMSYAAASGVETSGSVLDIIEETAYNIEMDALVTRTNYANQALAAKTEAKYTRAGKSSGLSMLINAAGSGLGAYAAFKSLG